VNPLDFLLRNPSGRDAGSIARQRLNARAAVPKSGGGVPRATGGFLANPIFAAYAIPGYSEQKSRNAAGVIEGTRGPLNELQYIGGELLRGRMPYSPNAAYYGPAYASAQALGLGGSTPSLRNYGPGYKEKELATGAAAERFRPGAGFPGQQGAADRAYQQELSRTAQLTAQDPELLRYETARAAAKTQEEMNSVRDMGMEMWAKKNPTLAAKVQPGQSGFDTIYKQTGQMPTPTFNPLMERTFPGMSRGAGEYTMGPSPLVPQIDPALNPAGPTYALGEGPRLMNFSDEKVTPEMIKAYQEQLLKQAGAK
jgi:hypothetical protein